MNPIRTWVALALALSSLAALPGASDGQSVALVTDLQGSAHLDDAKAPPLTILSELHSGNMVSLPAGSRASVVYLESGREFALVGPTEVRIGGTAPIASSGTPPSARGIALARGGGIRIKPVSVSQAAIILRGANAPQKLRLLSLEAGRSLSVSPRFEWQSPREGLEYRFELFDPTGKSLHVETTRKTIVELPSTVKLRPGENYSWLVYGRLGETSWSGAGDFTIASETLRAQVERLRPTDDSRLSDRVVFAAWLDENGLHDEARRYWRAVAAERKDDPAMRVLAGD